MTPRSLHRGGTALLISSLILVIATAIEAPLLSDPGQRGGGFVAYAVLFLLSGLGFVISGFLLAGGGTPVLARLGFIVFGLGWLVADVLWLIGYYLAAADALVAVSTVASVIMLIGGLLAAIVVLARKAASGTARWVFLVSILISGIAGGIAGGSADAAVVTVLHIVSAVALAVTGLVYAATARSAAGTR